MLPYNSDNFSTPATLSAVPVNPVLLRLPSVVGSEHCVYKAGGTGRPISVLVELIRAGRDAIAEPLQTEVDERRCLSLCVITAAIGARKPAVARHNDAFVNRDYSASSFLLF